MASKRRNPRPFLYVLSYETGVPVYIVPAHVRSVRPIREEHLDNETVTRIEFGNGDALDTSDTLASVLDALRAALLDARSRRYERDPR